MAFSVFLTAFIFLSLSALSVTAHPANASGDSIYQRFPFLTTNASRAIASGPYDYIIVGGGTAACPLAATLSQRFRVLVIERGKSPYGDSDIEDFSDFGKAFSKTDAFTSIAQSVRTEDGLSLVRARVLGGGTALNAGFYSRANPSFISDMAWNTTLVRQSYLWVESLNAFRPDNLTRWSTTLRDALIEAGVLPFHGYTLDHVEGTKISASIFDNRGHRHTAADLLSRADPRNILVLLNSTVTRINFSGKRAVGVEFMSFDGSKHNVSLESRSSRSEVILSAGSMGSPQVLMLSGIGPAAHLRQMGIPVVSDVPGVGEGIQDNPRVTVNVQSPVPLETSSIQVVGILPGSQIYVESSSSNSTSPNEGVLFTKLAFPASRGRLLLRSLDPRENPSVRYNYYSESVDLEGCAKGVRILRRLLQTTAVQRYAFVERQGGQATLNFSGATIPRSDANASELADYCRRTLNTMWHFHGGCHNGSVVDRDYKVVGLQNVRVVDGSTFKDGPGTNPQATTMMLGRYVGVKMLHERGCRAT